MLIDTVKFNRFKLYSIASSNFMLIITTLGLVQYIVTSTPIMAFINTFINANNSHCTCNYIYKFSSLNGSPVVFLRKLYIHVLSFVQNFYLLIYISWYIYIMHMLDAFAILYIMLKIILT